MGDSGWELWDVGEGVGIAERHAMRCSGRAGGVEMLPGHGVVLRRSLLRRQQRSSPLSRSGLLCGAHFFGLSRRVWVDRSARPMKHDLVVRIIDILPSMLLSGVFAGVMHWLKKGAAFVWYFRRSTGLSPLPAPAATPSRERSLDRLAAIVLPFVSMPFLSPPKLTITAY